MRKIETEIVIDETRKTPKVVIFTDEITDEIKSLCERLESDGKINCFDERGIERVSEIDIIRVYSSGSSVFAETAEKTYNLHERLYEAEEKLDKTVFVRISKSEIVNSRKILKLDVKMTGTIGIELKGGIISFVSRRYVSKIKEFFGI